MGGIIDISRQEPFISFLHDDSIRDLLEYNASTISEEYKLSPNPVDILTFDNIFLECDIAEGKNFKGKRSGIIHKLTMDVNPG